MSKSFSYPNKGTCSKETHIVLNDDHTIESIEVIGGCNGNLKGISRLLKGMKAERTPSPGWKAPPAAPAPPAALTRSHRTSSALWLSCNLPSVQKTTVLPLFPAGRTAAFLFIALFKNSADRNGIFAIGNSTLLLLH